MRFFNVHPLSRGGRPMVLPAHSIRSIELDPDFSGRVYGLNGEQVGWIDPGHVPLVDEDRTVVPAQPGWWVVTAGHDGLRRDPIVAWRVDDRPRTGGVKPVTASWGINEAVELGGFLYALLPPEGDALDSEGEPLGTRDDAAVLAHLEAADRYADAQAAVR